MTIYENISLRSYHTFGTDVYAEKLGVFDSIYSLQILIDQYKTLQTQLVLGGGSNILFTENVKGLVLKNEIKGIEILKEDAHHVWVKVGAGENWHAFVLYCLERNFAGVENLALIPGCVGASPMQNIGAYGREIKDVFYSLEALHLQENKLHTFSNNDCEFGYRESVFKKQYKNQFAITSVTYQLSKLPTFHVEYGAIQKTLEEQGVKDLSIQAIAQAVIAIRGSKLPDPKEIGNAGSFFKNPSIPKQQYVALQKQHPKMVGYENADGTVKVAAGWLIEEAGWKGFRQGDAGVHAKQALVLVNYGTASGKEIFDISERIIADIENKFGIVLEREVNIL